MAQLRKDSGNPYPELPGWALTGRGNKGVEGCGVDGQASGVVGSRERLWFP